MIFKEAASAIYQKKIFFHSFGHAHSETYNNQICPFYQFWLLSPWVLLHISLGELQLRYKVFGGVTQSYILFVAQLTTLSEG